MRWNPPSERTQFILLSPIIVPVCIVALPIFASMALGIWILQYFEGPQGWKPWFAWRPVRLDYDWDTKTQQWAWLERIEQHSRGGYRTIKLPTP